MRCSVCHGRLVALWQHHDMEAEQGTEGLDAVVQLRGRHGVLGFGRSRGGSAREEGAASASLQRGEAVAVADDAEGSADVETRRCSASRTRRRGGARAPGGDVTRWRARCARSALRHGPWWRCGLAPARPTVLPVRCGGGASREEPWRRRMGKTEEDSAAMAFIGHGRLGFVRWTGILGVRTKPGHMAGILGRSWARTPKMAQACLSSERRRLLGVSPRE
jgi:hypothetical protein